MDKLAELIGQLANQLGLEVARVWPSFVGYTWSYTVATIFSYSVVLLIVLALNFVLYKAARCEDRKNNSIEEDAEKEYQEKVEKHTKDMTEWMKMHKDDMHLYPTNYYYAINPVPKRKEKVKAEYFWFFTFCASILLTLLVVFIGVTNAPDWIATLSYPEVKTIYRLMGRP